MPPLKHQKTLSPLVQAVFSALVGMGAFISIIYLKSQLQTSNLYPLIDPILKIFPYLQWGILAWTVLSFLLIGWRYYQRKSWFDQQMGIHDIRKMSWNEFEQFSSEGYRRQGWQVFENRGKGPQSDGGIDLILKKPSQKVIVQCKCWRGKVGVKVVREMYGLMHHHKATGVKIIATGGYTKDAREFAYKKPIELVSPETLLSLRKPS